jgi:hypothetical protein
MSLKKVTTPEQVSQLAEHILDQCRKKIVLVITLPPHFSDTRYDSESLASETESVCDVFEIAGFENTWKLQELLPDGSHVHSGAARTYPVGFSKNQPTAMLRLAPSASSLVKLNRLLEGDVWASANSGGLLKKALSVSKKVSATVKMLFQPNGALVSLPDGQLASLNQDLVFPGIPVDWVYQVGQTIDGMYLANEKQFIPAAANYTASQALEHFGDRTVTLGIVRQTDRQSAQIEVFPNLLFTVPKNRITGNPQDVISRYLFLGDIVEVRIYKDDNGKVALRLDDIDDDEIVVGSLPLLPGGTPWLELNREFIETELDLDTIVPISMPVADESEQPVPSQAVFSPVAAVGGVPLPGPGAVRMAPAPVSSLALSKEQMYQQAISNLRGELAAAKTRYDKLLADYKRDVSSANSITETLKNQLELEKTRANSARDERKMNLQNKKQASDTFSRRSRFASDEQWMREEIRRVWIGRYTPDDRIRYPLIEDSYTFGADFFEYFNQAKLDEDEARKCVRAILDLVTLRNTAEKIRESHEVRGADNKPIKRNGDDGLRMWVEQGVPQAKRLSYFKLRSGGFELVKVDLHDNMKFD